VIYQDLRSMSGASYLEATEFVIRQQFHHDNNTIVDRTGYRSVVIPGADQIIESILNTIALATSLWVEGKYEQFLERLSSLFGLQSEFVLFGVNQKLETLASAGVNPVVEYMGAMGVILSAFRETIYNNLVQQILREYPEMKAFKEKLLDKLVLEESLLANMAMLYRLSAIVNVHIPEDYLKSEMDSVVNRIMA
jgi:hypothetical protein